MQTKKQQINTLQTELCTPVGDPNHVQIIYELADEPSIIKTKDIHTLAAFELINALNIFLKIVYRQIAHRTNLIQMGISNERS